MTRMLQDYSISLHILIDPDYLINAFTRISKRDLGWYVSVSEWFCNCIGESIDANL